MVGANGIEPLNFQILKSDDLDAWDEHTPAPGDVTIVDHGAYTEVQVVIPWSEPKHFLKMKVSTP